MFLRNYDNMMVLYHMSSGSTDVYNGSSEISINSASIFGDGYINVKRSDGSVAGFVKVYHSNNVLYITPLSRNNICIGTGVIPVTYEDYTLSGNILDNTKLAYVSSEVKYDSESRKVIKTATYTYTNETEESITISEWGLFRKWNTSSSSSAIKFSNSSYNILLYREVLDTPIVIEAGTTGTIKFKIEIPTNHP